MSLAKNLLPSPWGPLPDGQSIVFIFPFLKLWIEESAYFALMLVRGSGPQKWWLNLVSEYTTEKLKSFCLILCDPTGCSLQASLSMEFSRQEYWSGLHSLLQGIFPTQESNPGLPHCIAGRFFTIWATREGPDKLRNQSLFPAARSLEHKIQSRT